MKQQTLSDMEYSCRKKKTKREEFLEIMEEIIPWDEWVGIIRPYYPTGKRGRPPIDLEQMLRMYILYVNGEYRGDSDIGRLMRDFNCTDAGEMNFALLAERTKYLKENPEGVSEMCKVIEEMRKEEREAGIREGIKEGIKTTALRMLEVGKYALEDIADICGLTLDEVKQLQVKE